MWYFHAFDEDGGDHVSVGGGMVEAEISSNSNDGFWRRELFKVKG
jgi:hypothetical protein